MNSPDANPSLRELRLPAEELKEQQGFRQEIIAKAKSDYPEAKITVEERDLLAEIRINEDEIFQLNKIEGEAQRDNIRGSLQTLIRFLELPLITDEIKDDEQRNKMRETLSRAFASDYSDRFYETFFFNSYKNRMKRGALASQASALAFLISEYGFGGTLETQINFANQERVNELYQQLVALNEELPKTDEYPTLDSKEKKRAFVEEFSLKIVQAIKLAKDLLEAM